jgi:diadenosine tetraphosphate (Ap4A) HIT family hydrolase
VEASPALIVGSWGMACPFCEPEAQRVVVASPLVLVVKDAYPVSAGHLLVVPRRHVAGWDDASADEQQALLHGVQLARAAARAADPGIDAWNVGWNDGVAAGQTVMHLHVHVIPRRTGDVADPRGGVRWVLPARARYWEPA